MKFKLFLACSLILLAFGCGASQPTTAQQSMPGKTPLPVANVLPTPEPLPELVKTENWLTFRRADGVFEFKYPPNFKIEQKSNSVRLFHQTKFKHRSPCEPQINSDGQPDEYEGKKLDYLVDFDVSFRIVEGGIREAYLAEKYEASAAAELAEKFEKLDPSKSLFSNGRFDPAKIKLYEHQANSGGCGDIYYMLPPSVSKTLIVKRLYVTLTNASATYLLDTPVSKEYRQRLKKTKEAIFQDAEKQIFYTVLSTWRNLR